MDAKRKKMKLETQTVKTLRLNTQIWAITNEDSTVFLASASNPKVPNVYTTVEALARIKLLGRPCKLVKAAIVIQVVQANRAMKKMRAGESIPKAPQEEVVEVKDGLIYIDGKFLPDQRYI